MRRLRLVPLLPALLVTLGVAPSPAADETAPPVAPPAVAPPAGAGYAFTPKERLVYAYAMTQTTSFESAGDKLDYSTQMSWKFMIVPRTVEAGRAELGVTIISVAATMTGPGTRHEFDASHPTSESEKDPVFGHLAALFGAELVVTIDPRDGSVLAVAGGDAIAAAVAKRDPRFGPGEPSPLEAQAQAAYSSETLARMWAELLALPATAPQAVPLGPPFTGALVRTWTGGAYALALPHGIDHLDVALGHEPVAVAGTVTAVVGKGSVAPVAGVPGTAEGELAFTLTLTALTQPVVEHQTLRWALSRIRP